MIVFIVNERSGNGRGKRAWDAIERRMRELERSSSYLKVTAPSEEEAVRRVEALAEKGGVTTLIAVGGDGTLHALLPLAVRCQLPLGLIPSGSGNDTARAFGLPRDPLAALDVALNGSVTRVDILQTTAAITAAPEVPTAADISQPTPLLQSSQPTLSLTCIAAGLDGAVAEDVDRSRYKRWCNRLGIGSLAYIIGLFRTLVRFKSQTFTITVDGVDHEFRDSWLAAVANTPVYGGGLRICPAANPADGLLQVCVVHGCTALQLLFLFPSVLFGRHVRSRFVTILSGKNAAIRAPIPLTAYGDGEYVGNTPLEAAIARDQLLILTSCSG